MIKIIQILCLIILGIISYFAYMFHFNRNDELAYIYTANDIVEYYKIHGNNIENTQYNDRKYALEFLDICYKLENIDLLSQEFLTLSGIWKLKNYMHINDIWEPKDCIQWELISQSELSPSCIFDNEDSLHAPYLAAYLNGTITIARFSNSMWALYEYNKIKYPANAYILKALWDKSIDVTVNKKYCEDIIKANITDFIKPLDHK